MGEATDGRMWWPSGVCFTPQISLLVDVFIQETGAELVEADIASCWGQLLEEVPCQKDEGTLAEVISCLDELAQHMPIRKTSDEFVFLPSPAEPHAPHQSRHLGYIMGHSVDLGSALPSLQFHVSGPNGEFICIAWGLLFEGSVLTYDPTTNGAEWVPMQGTTSNLSSVEEASTQELSNIVIQDPPEDAPRIDSFRECREKHSAEAPTDTFCMDAALHEEESMEQAAQSDLGDEGSESSKESDSSESTPHHYSLRCHHPNSISWADEDQEEGKEQEETEWEEQPTLPASSQGEPMEEPMGEPTEEPVEELPTLEHESLGLVPTIGDMPRDSEGEEVVIHVAEEKIDHLC